MSDKGKHEEFSRFFETPTREAFRELVRSHYGELDTLDFKEQFPSYSKLARHVLAMANSGGGCIVFGLSQEQDGSMKPVGLASLNDKADITKGVSGFLPPRLAYEVLDFSFQASEYPALMGKKFQVIIVDDKPEDTPFVCPRDGDGIRRNAIYARKGTSSEEVDDYQLQQIINRRLETGHSTADEMELEKELRELRILWSECGYPEFVPDDQLDDMDRCLRQLIQDKLLAVRGRLGITEKEMWHLRILDRR